jgi:hypothetical protein
MVTRTVSRKARQAQPRRGKVHAQASVAPAASALAELPEHDLESWYALKQRLEALQLRARDIHALADVAETATGTRKSSPTRNMGRVLGVIASSAFSLAEDLDPVKVLAPGQQQKDEAS